MRLFGNKEICPICGQPAKGLFNIKIKDDVTLCKECSEKIAIEPSMRQFQTVDDIKDHLAYREENLKLFQSFSPTNEVKFGNCYFREDKELKKWCFVSPQNSANPELFDYDEIIDYEFTENGEQITTGGLGSAVAGGLLLGSTGAIVGSNVGKKKSKTSINSMQIRISLSNKYRNQILIDLLPLKSEIKSGSLAYTSYKSQADKLVSFLDSLCNKVNAATHSSTESHVSEADEILKFKSLLDSGIISQEEFEAKKKQLLGL